MTARRIGSIPELEVPVVVRARPLRQPIRSLDRPSAAQQTPIGYEELAQLLDRAMKGVWSLGVDGTLHWSGAVAVLHRIMGEEGSFPASRFLERLRPEDLTAVLDGLVRAGTTGFAWFEYSWFVGESERRIRACASAQIEAGGGVFFHGLAEDVTDRVQFERVLVQAREEALAASNVKSRFLANMSHEIRTPMNAVIGMTQLLMETPLDAEQLEYLGDVERSGNALLVLINDILDLSQIEAQKVELESGALVPAETLNDVCHLLASRAHAKGVEIVLDLDASVAVEAVGDPVRFRQVITNLVGNAIKFTSEGEVVVRAHVAHGLLVVIVEDTGVGIPEESLGAIFEPFHQVDNERTRAHGGNGLGLSISRELVSLMHGTLSVTSAQGIGSRFALRIPLTKIKRREADQSPELSGHVVAVLCGRPALGEAVGRTLVRLGAEVQVFHDAADLLRNVLTRTRGPVDVVIDDDIKGALDGPSLAWRVAGLPGVGSITLLTRQTTTRMAEEQHRDVISAFVRKPPRVEALSSAILSPTRGALGSRSITRAPPPPLTFDPRHVRGVLVVEDDDVNARLTCALVKKFGLQAVRVRNGREAVERAAGGDISVILMDLHMPELDGIEATLRIRKQEKGTGRRIPIIALTADAMRGERERCLAAGMDRYLTKPINPGMLRATLASCIADCQEPATATV